MKSKHPSTVRLVNKVVETSKDISCVISSIQRLDIVIKVESTESLSGSKCIERFLAIMWLDGGTDPVQYHASFKEYKHSTVDRADFDALQDQKSIEIIMTKIKRLGA